jgi:SSS family solute:Na+ symporter
MILEWIDWLSILLFFVISLAIGISVMRKAGASSVEFFASGKNMPWWLLGISMVATTFSADTPNLVTDIVRQQGVAGNWQWWAFLITGLITVFIYARLWRKSEVLTDIEFYELRYSGKAAAFLRGFRAIYLGVFFNIMIMAAVLLAGNKFASVLLGIPPWQTIIITSIIVVAYTMLGGLRGVLLTDFVQFIIAMVGSVAAAIVILNLPQVGGLENLLSHPNVKDSISLLPDFSDTSLLVTVFIIPLAVQWWSVWYPGSEPGGGGYIAQRMLAAKDENHAIGATLLFTGAHYALRPWPWIIIALASMIVFPDLAALQTAFPNVPQEIIRNDLAYSAMLTYLPAGLLGIVVASIIAAVMSTISTHLNWGASYIVNDVYKRFYCKDGDEKKLVLAGRLAIILLMIAAAMLALLLSNALQAFHILLQIGAGTGLLFLLRWFWYRINAASEIAAMAISFLVATYFEFIHVNIGLAPLESWQKLLLGVGITTAGWVTVTLLTKPADRKTLEGFYRKVRPWGKGWKGVLGAEIIEEVAADPKMQRRWELGPSLLAISLALVAIYGALFGTGFILYGKSIAGLASLAMAVTASLLLYRVWRKVSNSVR